MDHPIIARVLPFALALPLLTAVPGSWAFSVTVEEECGCWAHRMERAERERPTAGPGDGKGGVFDATNGRDHRNFPPDPQVQFQRMKLAMRFEDMTSGRFTGTETLTIVPIGVPVQVLRLDAAGMKVSSVTVDGRDAEFSNDGEALSIRFAQPLVPAAGGGQTAASTVVIAYSCDRPMDGLTFSVPTPEIPGVAPARGAEVHTQGQTETNHYWFPIHDFPNIRMATELVIDVPAGFQASSNGALVKHEVRGDREVWHWNQEKPHVPYLVSVVIGDFDHAELPSTLSGVPMTVWAPKGRGDDAKATYERTDRMMVLFERVFGQKYPWARYDQLVVRNFGAGGMENTSATTMQPSAVLDATARNEQDLDGLISHELCHQWTGDLITCRSWAHIWLNEGWATYGTTLWMEERDGADGYWDSVLGNAGVARGDVATAPEAMCSPVYTNAGETFGRPANPYPKGASILHMLRRMLGDRVFFAGVQSYFARHALGNAETYDFRRAMEEASGLGLEWFFDQWCFRPGSPQLKAKCVYDAASRVLTMTAEQTQQIDARTPAMRISIPVWVKTEKGEVLIPMEMTGRTGTVSKTLDAPPVAVWVDPYLEALKTVEVTQPELWTLGALRSAPTHAAKRQALAALAKVESPDARMALLETARNDSLRFTLRIDAVNALAAYGSKESQEAVLALARSPIADVRVRAAVIGALEKVPAADAVPLCRNLLIPPNGGAGEASYIVRVQAIDVLTAHAAKDAIDTVRAQVAVPSHNESISAAALRYLGKFGDASDVERIESRTTLGLPDRVRPAAVSALADVAARLTGDERTKVETFLIGLLDDAEERTAMAAGGALAELKCQAAKDRLRAIAEHHRDPSWRKRAAEWVKKLAA